MVSVRLYQVPVIRLVLQYFDMLLYSAYNYTRNQVGNRSNVNVYVYLPCCGVQYIGT